MLFNFMIFFNLFNVFLVFFDFFIDCEEKLN